MTTIEQQFANILLRVRSISPLIHNITNMVVANFVANGLYALGSSPVMAHAPEEVADMAKISSALVLNLGTPSVAQLESMIIAGLAANRHKIPVLLDPVGVGATKFRTKIAHEILQKVNISLIRGNFAEIANLVGDIHEIKGIDGGGNNGNHVDLALRAARELNIAVAITGKQDVIAKDDSYIIINGGSSMLTKITGGGCLLTAVIASFIAVEQHILLAGAAGLAFYSAASSRAAKRLIKQQNNNINLNEMKIKEGQKDQIENIGSGSFQVAFLDELSRLNESSLNDYISIESFIKS